METANLAVNKGEKEIIKAHRYKVNNNNKLLFIPDNGTNTFSLSLEKLSETNHCHYLCHSNSLHRTYNNHLDYPWNSWSIQ